MTSKVPYSFAVAFFFAFTFLRVVHADEPTKHRLIVLTDIEADPDDTQSLVRLLLYSNQIDIEGLVATTSVHMKDRINPESIRSLIRNYRKVRSNLETHEKGYPEANHLLGLVKDGVAGYGMEAIAPGKSSLGSDWIIEVLERDDARPVWISVWGGANTLAQALMTIRETKTNEEAAELIKKIRVYAISDQDDSGHWVRSNFPDLFYIVTPGGYGGSTWSAIYKVLEGDNHDANNAVIGNAWIAEHIQQNHGPLGSSYPDVTWSMEGDTPAFLALIPNGLNVPDKPNWGGWGGRYELKKPDPIKGDVGFTGGVPYQPETRKIWSEAVDKWFPLVASSHGRAIRPYDNPIEDNQVSLLRWREEFQNDFAARMDWCIKPYSEANHPPVPALSHPERFSVEAGTWFSLDATGTIDPDDDSLSYFWITYPEAGTCKAEVFNDKNLQALRLKAPEVEESGTLHFVLKVTDKGTPPLSRYKRVIVTVEPK